MSTKQNPGQFDCYAKLADDEPYFVLRAKDPFAPALVRLWAEQRRVQYGIYPKLEEAMDCARQMEGWRLQHPEATPSVPTGFITGAGETSDEAVAAASERQEDLSRQRPDQTRGEQ